MFQLTEYENDKQLFHYLSSIASQTILKGLNEWIVTEADVEELYTTYFSEESADLGGKSFFDGLSQFISVDTVSQGIMVQMAPSRMLLDLETGADALVGMEFIWRKFCRMKEKMADPDKYYTFDLLEEYLFSMMIDRYVLIEELMEEEDSFNLDELGEIANLINAAKQAEPELIKKIGETEKELIEKYHLGAEEAASVAESICRIEKMDVDNTELFFWDLDFAFLFEDSTFVEGIRKVISGTGAYLGYRYEDICSIFSDAGINVPLLLVGSRAAYEARGEVTFDRVVSMDLFGGNEEADDDKGFME